MTTSSKLYIKPTKHRSVCEAQTSLQTALMHQAEAVRCRIRPHLVPFVMLTRTQIN